MQLCYPKCNAEDISQALQSLIGNICSHLVFLNTIKQIKMASSIIWPPVRLARGPKGLLPLH